ncbi:MAG: CBS domain-containing protein [Thermoleophilia bacterium]
MSTIDQILATKGHDVFTVSADSTVFDALQTMAERNVGALVVLDGELIVGMFSERDYARKVILHGLSSPRTLVRQVMTSAVIYATPNQSVEECMALMATDKHVRHLPVLDSAGRVVGVISVGDLVRSSIADKEFLIDQLERYIVGH